MGMNNHQMIALVDHQKLRLQTQTEELEERFIKNASLEQSDLMYQIEAELDCFYLHRGLAQKFKFLHDRHVDEFASLLKKRTSWEGRNPEEGELSAISSPFKSPRHK